ncbi:MAG: hypothetical protein KBB46_02335 [Candidatus Pacebacteria bacterium]|nr:hypothetical protein [Candidatus Paceibacterota bacterium]
MTLTSIINTMTDVVTLAVPWVLVFLIFYWNAYKIIFDADNAEKRKQALPRLIWSIVALAIIFSLGGIVNIISNTLLGSSNSTFAPSSSSPSPGSPELLGGPRSGTVGTPPSGTSPTTPRSPINPNIDPRGEIRTLPSSGANSVRDI